MDKNDTLAVDNKSEDTLYVVEKLYEDGWHWYCGYNTSAEAEVRADIVKERDNREVRVRKFVEVRNETKSN